MGNCGCCQQRERTDRAEIFGSTEKSIKDVLLVYDMKPTSAQVDPKSLKFKKEIKKSESSDIEDDIPGEQSDFADNREDISNRET